MDSKLIEDLMAFGLSRQEALIYMELLRLGQTTGYEISKETGISRSNVYQSLSELVNKGACYLIQGEATKYVAVKVNEFLNNTLNILKEKSEYIKKHAPLEVVECDGYITVKGFTNIKNIIRKMLTETELRVYVQASGKLLELFTDELKALILQKKKIVILSDYYEMTGAKVYHTKTPEDQIRLITDSSYVLTGVVSGSEDDTCLYSGQTNLVDVMKEALKNKIILLDNNEGK